MRFSSAVALCLLSIAMAAAAQPPAPSSQQLTAPYIFRGTVVRATPENGLIIVRVDEIFRGARTVGDFTGQEIVVERAAPNERKVAIFFTTPVAYGKTVTVREVSELDPVNDAETLRRQIAEAERQDADRKTMERLRTADAVINGHVVDIAPLERKERHPSEHDPDWMVAHVAVRRTDAGKPALHECNAPQSCVTVVFAASDDVMWVASPKLARGEDAILLLHRAAAPPLLPAMRPNIDAYVLVDRADRWPVSEEPRLQKLLAALR